MPKAHQHKTKHFLIACVIGLLACSTAMADEGIRQFKEFIATVNNAEGEFTQQQIRPSKTGDAAPKALRKS